MQIGVDEMACARCAIWVWSAGLVARRALVGFFRGMLHVMMYHHFYFFWVSFGGLSSGVLTWELASLDGHGFGGEPLGEKLRLCSLS